VKWRLLGKNLKDVFQGKAPFGKKRSPQWKQVRRDHLKRQPLCMLCGGRRKLEVHHIVPFHVDPTKELDPANLITLCESRKGGVTCHQFIGHMGNYRWSNDRVIEDVTYLAGRLVEERKKNTEDK
jgi:5-methylcytosine-specific restriction protein A